MSVYVHKRAHALAAPRCFMLMTMSQHTCSHYEESATLHGPFFTVNIQQGSVKDGGVGREGEPTTINKYATEINSACPAEITQTERLACKSRRCAVDLVVFYRYLCLRAPSFGHFLCVGLKKLPPTIVSLLARNPLGDLNSPISMHVSLTSLPQPHVLITQT